jgi:hypothetical protein
MNIRVEKSRYDWSDALEIFIDDKEVFSVGAGEPEDNILSRNFNDCYKIPNLLELAYNAGKNGEEFKVEIHNIKEE